MSRDPRYDILFEPVKIGPVVKPPFYVPLPDRVSGTGGRMFRA